MSNDNQHSTEELDVHSYVPLICKKQTINIKTMSNQTEEQVICEVDMGEMINVWIEYHGYLDFDTDEQVIINFYNKIKGDNK
jgi:hypothetical protein